MVTITSGKGVPENPTLIVVSPDGDYADTDSILCAEPDASTLPVAIFEAQFVRYGSMVYRYNTPEELGKDVLAIDPSSTLDAVALYKEELARDAARTAGTLEPSDPAPVDTPVPVNNDQEADTQFFRQQAADEAASSTATSSPQLPDSPSGEVLGESTTTSALPDSPVDIATSTPDSPVPDSVPADAGNMSATTPAVPDMQPQVDLSTTTPPVPDVQPAVDLSTTTPE